MTTPTRTECDLKAIRARLSDESNIQAQNSESLIKHCQRLLQAPETTLEQKMWVVSVMNEELARQ
jgi:hypothetical protein